MTSRDVLANIDARAVLTSLTDRGIGLLVRRGKLASSSTSRLTDADRTAVAFHKPALMVLVLLNDDRTLDRLLALRTWHHAPGRCREPGRCHTCSDLLPRRRVVGRCGWCALAARLHAGAPIAEDIITLFDAAIAGPRTTGADRVSALAFDLAVPA